MSDSLASVVPSALAPLEHLVERARDYAANAISLNTRRAYTADFKTFETWCAHPERSFPSLPTNPAVLAVYLSALSDAGQSVATIERAQSGIGWMHREHGHPWSGHEEVRKVMNGIRRTRGVAQKQKAPVRDTELKALVATLGVDLIGLRDRALLTLGWSGAFRRSELVALEVDDVEFVLDGLVVNIRGSKTDQEWRGEKLGVPYAGDTAVCPVRAVKAWLEALAAVGITEGPIFRPITRHGRIRRQALSDRGVVIVVKRAAKRANLDFRRLAGHSLRSGFATTASEKGKSTRAIMRRGRWKSERTANRYIRDAGLFDDNAATGLV